MRAPLAGLLAVASVALVGAGAAATDDKLEEIPWRQARFLEVEDVGPSLGAAVVTALPALRLPSHGFVLPLWYRAEGLLHVVTIDLETQVVTAHEPVKAYEVWRTVALGGRLYLGLNNPGLLAEFDPVANRLRTLGLCVEKAPTVFSLVATPDGQLACGGGGGKSELSSYDPARGTFRRYGEASEGQGYVYSLWADREYLYAALRGRGPWELQAVNRESGAKSSLLTVPLDGYLNLRPGVVTITEHLRKENQRVRDAVLAQGKLTFSERGREPAPPGTRNLEPEVVLDTALVPRDGTLVVKYRLPEAEGAKREPATAQPWRSLSLRIQAEPKNIRRLLAWDDNTILGATGNYGPLLSYDVAKDQGRVLGALPDANVYSMARVGERLYLAGYPSAPLMSLDPTQPFTEREGPGRVIEPGASNPRLIARLNSILGASTHHGVAMAAGADGRIYVVGMRDRYAGGFGIAWYDPRSDRLGSVDDHGELAHQQVAWVAPLEGGRRLAIATRIQIDENSERPQPKEARLFLVDTLAGALAGSWAPLAGATALSAFAEAEPGIVVGLATDPPSNGSRGRSLLYRFDTRQDKTVATRAYSGVICGIASKMDLPRKGFDFQRGPDGALWTFYHLPWADSPDLLLRIDPKTLALLPVGKVLQAGERILFKGRDLYLAGAPRLRRIHL